MSQYPPYETCNLGRIHILPEFQNFGPGRNDLGKWKSIKNELPEYESAPFLGVIEGVIALCQYGESDMEIMFSWYPADFISPHRLLENRDKLTHWMHLPELPK
jgi:hypothetical protein